MRANKSWMHVVEKNAPVSTLRVSTAGVGTNGWRRLRKFAPAVILLTLCLVSAVFALAARKTATARKFVTSRADAMVPKAKTEPELPAKYGAIPLSFELNQG